MRREKEREIEIEKEEWEWMGRGLPHERAMIVKRGLENMRIIDMILKR